MSSNCLSQEFIMQYILDEFDYINPLETWGELSFFVNPGIKLKRGKYFATLKSKNGKNDKASSLDREGVFRLNIGLPSKDYETIFGLRPPKPIKGNIIQGDYDFTSLNTLTPHPIYGWMGWIAILNPSKTTFESCKYYLNVAYSKALKSV